MNSLLEVSTKILALVGSDSPSEFRLNKLKNLPSFSENIDLQCQEIYLCKIQDTEEISDEDLTRLFDLLKIKKDILSDYKSSFFITPRLGTISPWSSKATEIIQNCGLKTIERVERGMGYFFNHKIPTEQLSQMGFSLYDKMTQQVLTDIRKTSELFSISAPGNLKDINIFSEGKNALEKANRDLGLALSDDEIHYLYENYSKTNKNPTDAELMMFAQANSEHCRHKIFNASWSIDGEEHLNSLFDMIRNTYHNYSEGIISAYEDNAAILEGNKSFRFYPVDDRYGYHEEDINLVIKVETHNHPTAISPFSGASTGSGGEIRDEGATGIGAKPKAGLTGFSVSSLRIPSLTEKWETKEERPERISSPLNIMIEAPIGAASFNNEFGRPNILGYFRSYENKTDSHHYGYHKPIMLAGGLGNIKSEHVFKKEVPIGSKLIVLGGPAMLIGLGGGSASSLSSGEGDSDLDYASVQRENPEMERRCQEVLDRCWQSPQNPILFIHDVGAGGLSNAIPELVKDSGHGGIVNLRKIPNSEPGMTPMEIWCNESQERYVLAVSEEYLEKFSQICLRERCPFSIVGEIVSGNSLEVYDSLNDNYPISLSLDILFGKPPKTHLSFNRTRTETYPFIFDEKVTEEMICSVLRHPTVASKNFLITIGDRSVTGLIYRDQLVGPWQVPVSDYGMCKSSFSTKSGEAMAIGERTPLSLISSRSAARMSVAEVVTNIIPSGVGKISDIKLSANWMGSPGKLNGNEDLFEAVQAIGMELCPEWNMTIPVGKDSLSMSTEWSLGSQDKSVISPLSLIISGFSKTDDVSISITPQLKDEHDTSILFVDLAKGKRRMGGSIFSQVIGNNNGDSPDVECVEEMPAFVECMNKLLKSRKLLAYHDRSDGGLITTLCEMAFASRLGLDINLKSVISEKSELLNFLFNEELGIVIQVYSKDIDFVLNTLKKSNLHKYTYDIGSIDKTDKLSFSLHKKELITANTKTLLENWHRVGFEIQSLRDNPETAKSEFEMDTDLDQLGLSPKINFSIPKKIDIRSSNPTLAILREQGVNGQNEMAAAFTEVGFDCIDVHMTDLISNRYKLGDFQGLVACGGFSYGDVLGAGGGWAKTIMYNENLSKQFYDFFHNEHVFSLGVCNGCQTLSNLSSLIPGTEGWPDFLKNSSEKFEARLVQVKVNDSPSIFFKGMAGSVIPVPVAHGEGRASFTDENIKNKKNSTISYVNDRGKETDVYPANPNGSTNGIAGVTNSIGNVTIMMPHPERAFLKDQLSWSPDDWELYSPWISFFNNAREFID